MRFTLGHHGAIQAVHTRFCVHTTHVRFLRRRARRAILSASCFVDLVEYGVEEVEPGVPVQKWQFHASMATEHCTAGTTWWHLAASQRALPRSQCCPWGPSCASLHHLVLNRAVSMYSSSAGSSVAVSCCLSSQRFTAANEMVFFDVLGHRRAVCSTAGWSGVEDTRWRLQVRACAPRQCSGDHPRLRAQCLRLAGNVGGRQVESVACHSGAIV